MRPAGAGPGACHWRAEPPHLLAHRLGAASTRPAVQGFQVDAHSWHAAAVGRLPPENRTRLQDAGGTRRQDHRRQPRPCRMKEGGTPRPCTPDVTRRSFTGQPFGAADSAPTPQGRSAWGVSSRAGHRSQRFRDGAGERRRPRRRDRAATTPAPHRQTPDALSGKSAKSQHAADRTCSHTSTLWKHTRRLHDCGRDATGPLPQSRRQLQEGTENLRCSIGSTGKFPGQRTRPRAFRWAAGTSGASSRSPS